LVDVYDVVVLVDHVLGYNSYSVNFTNSDINHDNVLDIYDVILLIDYVLGNS